MSNINGWTMNEFKQFNDLLIKANDKNLMFTHKMFIEEIVKRQYVQDNIIVKR